ncbi:MAG: hypothetical protein IJD13_02125, partial [Oscillospiraceae bacterium]|nr:hypothetical protein [Oscillospiraceae bacterium]
MIRKQSLALTTGDCLFYNETEEVSCVKMRMTADKIHDVIIAMILLFMVLSCVVGMCLNYLSAAEIAERNIHRSRTYDVRIRYAAGFTDGETALFENAGFVSEYMPAYSAEVSLQNDGDLFVFSDSEPLNRPELIEGRMPEKGGECVLAVNGNAGFAAVSSISLNKKSADMLRRSEYKVVGYIQITDELQDIVSDAGCIFIPADDFLTEGYTDIWLTLKKAEPFSPLYEKNFSAQINAITDDVLFLEELWSARRFGSQLDAALSLLEQSKRVYPDRLEEI